MKISTVLFDLDGTLLPMDNDEFTKGYFKLLVKKLAPYGYEQQELVSAIWKGTAAMVKNDGTLSNYDVFWKAFEGSIEVSPERVITLTFHTTKVLAERMAKYDAGLLGQ